MQTTATPTTAKKPTPNERKRAVQIVAKSLYKELCSQGFDEKQIVALATELIGVVTTKIQTPSA